MESGGTRAPPAQINSLWDDVFLGLLGGDASDGPAGPDADQRDNGAEHGEEHVGRIGRSGTAERCEDINTVSTPGAERRADRADVLKDTGQVLGVQTALTESLAEHTAGKHDRDIL